MKHTASISGNRIMAIFRLWISLGVIALSVFTGDPAASQGNQPLFEIQAPDQVAVDEPIELIMRARHVPDMAGYEATLLFDPTIAEFGGVEQRENDIKKIGRDVSPLTAINLPNGVAVGLYSCAFDSCVSPKGPKKDKGANGTIRLATVTLHASEPGSLEIKVDAAKFVDAKGNPFEVNISTPTIVVQVERTEPYHPAPGSMWSLPSSAPPDPGPFDLTGDDLVNHADAAEVAIEWQITRLDGAPCSPADPSRDINHDGCVDVADTQLVAANYSADASLLPIIRAGSILEEQAPDAPTSTFTVNSTGDEADWGIGNGVCATISGTCTLRAAINEANAHTGADTIDFNIPGGGVQTIHLAQRLPTLNDATGPTTIDGYTQPGSAPNSNPLTSNAAIRVQIEGGGDGSYDSFVITSPGNILRGLAVYQDRRSIWIFGSGAANNRITGTFIGTNAAGSYTAPAYVPTSHGLHIEQGASSTRVGGTNPAERNVISGNSEHGLGIWHEHSDGNVILNNIVGLNPLGTGALPNRKHGIDLNYGSSSNIVGGLGPGERNVSSGNLDTGIEVSHLPTTADNLITGNYFGTNLDGTGSPAYAANGGRGIMVEDGASNNTISGNVIGNNLQGGIEIRVVSSVGNQISNNRIGVGVDGSAITVKRFGLLINGNNTVVGPGNIIANTEFNGIKIEANDADRNTITANSIYNNGFLGINLLPEGVNPNDPNDTDTGPNEQLNYPVLESASPSQVTGTACGGCTVEVFIADRGSGAYGQGKTFVGSAAAGGDGSFSISIGGAAVGDFVTATATDSDGNTSEFSLNRIVSSDTPPPPNTYAVDPFSRNVTNGWGSADIGGGYALTGSVGDYQVNGSSGTMRVPSAGQARRAILGTVSAQDVEITFRLQTDKLASGNGEYAYFVARRVSTNTEYRGQVRFSTSQTVHLQMLRIVNGAASTLGAEVRVNGLVHAANSAIWVKAQVVGTNPTTFRLKAWADGQAEPGDWQYTATDSTANLQAAGSLGLMINLPTGSSNAPVVFSFDDFLAIDPNTP